MTRFVKSWLGVAATTAALGVGGGQAFAQKEAHLRPAVRPHRADGERGHCAVPRLPRLHRPGEQQGRRRGLQDQGHRDRQRVQGAAGHRGARALQEGRRRPRRPLRHAADRGAEQEAEEDKILGTSPGFGTAAAADGKRYPYTFPIAASYWSQAGAAVAFAKEKLAATSRARRSPTSIYDNPAGKEPMADPRGSRQDRGLRNRIFAVPAPGLEMGAQVLDITGASSRTSSSPTVRARTSVAIKELKGKGFPLSKVIGFGLGQRRGRHRRGWRHGRGRRLQHDPVRRRRQGLPGDQGHRGDVQGPGQARAQGDGLDRATTTAAS